MISMTFCGKCGYNNPEECHFCVNCGSDLSESIGQQGVPEEVVNTEQTEQTDQAGQFDQAAPAQEFGAAPEQPREYIAPTPAPADPFLNPQQQYAEPPARKRRNLMGEYHVDPLHEYDPTGRAFGIMLSVIALVITLVALFIIPTDFAQFDRTLLRVGMMPDQIAILAMTIVTLAIAVISLVEPLLNIGTGICLIVTATLVYTSTTVGFMTVPGLIVYILLAVDIIVLGVVSMIFMRKFVNNNIKGVPLFKACLLAWTGIPHL